MAASDGMDAGFVSNSLDKKSKAVLSSRVFYRETTPWSLSIFPLSMYVYQTICANGYICIHTYTYVHTCVCVVVFFTSSGFMAARSVNSAIFCDVKKRKINKTYMSLEKHHASQQKSGPKRGRSHGFLLW